MFGRGYVSGPEIRDMLGHDWADQIGDGCTVTLLCVMDGATMMATLT